MEGRHGLSVMEFDDSQPDTDEIESYHDLQRG